MTARADWNGSYLLGNDTVTGWGTRYYFSFYSEFGERGWAPWAEAGALALVFLGSAAANGGVAAAVLWYRQMRTVTNCFLLNLAVADLLFALGIPAVLLARLDPRWRLGDLPCRLLPYSQVVCSFVLLWTLTLISMDRHRCLAVPPFQSRLTPRRAALLTAATWAVALLLFLPVALWFRHEPTLHICTLAFPRSDVMNWSVVFTVLVMVVACVLPMSLLIYHYQRIFSKLVKTRRRWASSVPLPCDKSAESLPNRPPARHASTIITSREQVRVQRHVRVLRLLLLNVLVVLHMWLPITAVMLLVHVDARRPLHDTSFFLRSHHFVWALLLAFLNTFVNPIIYGLMTENFRSGISRLWFGSRRRRAAATRALSLDAPRRSEGTDVAERSRPSPGSVVSLNECSAASK